MSRLVLTGWLVAFAACAGGADDEQSGAPEDTAGGAPAATEPGAGAAERAETTAMIAEMRSHLGVITAAGGDEMVPMVPPHRTQVENLITHLNGELSRTGRTPGAAWTATVDSLRQDLTRMNGMPANELEALMDTHAERVTRLIEMYEGASRGGQPR